MQRDTSSELPKTAAGIPDWPHALWLLLSRFLFQGSSCSRAAWKRFLLGKVCGFLAQHAIFCRHKAFSGFILGSYDKIDCRSISG